MNDYITSMHWIHFAVCRFIILLFLKITITDQKLYLLNQFDPFWPKLFYLMPCDLNIWKNAKTFLRLNFNVYSINLEIFWLLYQNWLYTLVFLLKSDAHNGYCLAESMILVYDVIRSICEFKVSSVWRPHANI